MRTLRFAKVEGSGNDFVVVEGGIAEESVLPCLARKICDRHLGIGADGLVLYKRLSSEDPPSRGAAAGSARGPFIETTGQPETKASPFPPSQEELDASSSSEVRSRGMDDSATQAHFSMRLFNADGSEAEISGNGLRCLAAHVFRQGLHTDGELRVQTLAGTQRIRMIDSEAVRFTFEVEMGRPVLDSAQITFHVESSPRSLIGCRLPVDDELYSVTITSMGNPHCSIFVDSFESLEWKRIGAQIEVHPAFPERTNVEFVKVINPEAIEARFWERGVGATLSSGTGACAAMVASVLNGYAGRKIRVMTSGGELKIEWRPDGVLQMTGPANITCQGEFYLDDAS